MNKITKNTMGMFDCLKGVIVILVILSHCFEEVWAVNNCTDYSIAWKAIHCMTGIVMGIFFVISGYGFRPVKNLRGIKNQAKLLLRANTHCILMFYSIKNDHEPDHRRRYFFWDNGTAVGPSFWTYTFNLCIWA